MIVARLKHKEFPRHPKCDAYPRQGNPPKVNLVSAIDALLRSAARVEQSGNPQTDWTRVKWALRSSDNSTLASVASAIDYLVAFNRGHRIAANLSEQWIACGVYSEARDAIDSALMQEQILSNSTGPLKGIHVMNMHKCKGKKFDGVVLYREQHSSPFVWKGDPAPHPRSRKLLHVAITRARRHVLVLDEAFSSCPIIGPHVL